MGSCSHTTRSGDEAWLPVFVVHMQGCEVINTHEHADLKRGMRAGCETIDVVGERSQCGWVDLWHFFDVRATRLFLQMCL